jgi:hypothetical protein
VRRRGTAPIAALGVALLLFALSGCGGSDGSTGDSTATGGGPPAGAATGKREKGSDPGEGGGNERADDPGGGSAGSGPKVQTAPLKVSGGGSTQYRVPGGDNSIQEFGEESDETELEEAAASLHGYLVARAEEDWVAACANLAKSVEEQLQVLASRSENLEGEGCAAVLQALAPTLPASVRRESTVVDAGSLRLEDGRAFLIYRGAEGATYAIVMVPEDGGWKVGSLAATPLS